MTTSLITVRTDTKLKEKAMNIANSLGFSLSSLVNAYLRHFVKTKTVHFEESYEPTPYLKRLIAQARKEHEEGKSISFSNPQDAISFLDTVIK
ncbi:type II toxin-antitoxin system RelB/DinJ family antitoxin [Patescibacteria group bacterium]|nr:type II toxin-antitoxin system RelB/DinJ family antitoxin [Patescibacteria group bacterium]MBU1472597.1 type II toxin-antitoxin system RelB/DinJ family antitoxin [Patescibacteria group bacterium]MBU2459849.1 type II toxin-antitoxin system RelB/DinJ family antitoxin [Patescibacteria group bacterium]MBU2544090.1 type II toxin-antitoxin system RelB/DinJ family antitoxin [Patescibacteria group bacterium]